MKQRYDYSGVANRSHFTTKWMFTLFRCRFQPWNELRKIESRCISLNYDDGRCHQLVYDACEPPPPSPNPCGRLPCHHSGYNGGGGNNYSQQVCNLLVRRLSEPILKSKLCFIVRNGTLQNIPEPFDTIVSVSYQYRNSKPEKYQYRYRNFRYKVSISVSVSLFLKASLKFSISAILTPSGSLKFYKKDEFHWFFSRKMVISGKFWYQTGYQSIW